MTQYSEQRNCRLRPDQSEVLDAAVSLSDFEPRSGAFRGALVAWARDVVSGVDRERPMGRGDDPRDDSGDPTHSKETNVEIGPIEPREQRSEHMTFRATPTERRQIEQAAEAAGVSRSRFIRKATEYAVRDVMDDVGAVREETENP